MRQVMAALAVAMAATGAQAARDYTLVDIGTLGGPGSYGAAVSNDGTVVGCADVVPAGAHAFAWKDGVMRDLGLAGDATPGASSCALAVNDQGVIAGRSSTREVVVWNGARVTRLGVKGDVGGINDRGAVVGAYESGSSTRAFVYDGGILVTLTALGSDPAGPSAATSINSRGLVVGRSNGRAFLYDGGAMRDLGSLGGNNVTARDINDRGEIVGLSADATGQPTAFVYREAMQAIPGPKFSGAVSINNRGAVVGSAEGIHGWLSEGQEFTRLDTLPAVVAKGWRRLEPTGINDHGWIVGTANDASGNLRAFLLVPREGPAPKPLRLLR